MVVVVWMRLGQLMPMLNASFIMVTHASVREYDVLSMFLCFSEYTLCLVLTCVCIPPFLGYVLIYSCMISVSFDF